MKPPKEKKKFRLIRKPGLYKFVHKNADGVMLHVFVRHTLYGITIQTAI
jgi:hypothetical protein